MHFLAASFAQPGKEREVLTFYAVIYTVYYQLKLDRYLNKKACTR